MEDDFDFVGDRTIEEETTEVEEATEVEKEPIEETTEEKATEEEEPKNSLKQALDSERARRKQIEKELRDLRSKKEAEIEAKENEKKVESEKESLKKELMQDELIDEEVADKLVNTLGKRFIESKVTADALKSNADFEEAITKLKSNDSIFEDADVYKPRIKELMKNSGLSVEEAYFAVAGKNKLASLKKDLEVEIEQKLLNNEEKLDRVDLGHEESKAEVKNSNYTKREREIARETGLDLKEVHKRSKTFSLDDMLNL